MHDTGHGRGGTRGRGYWLGRGGPPRLRGRGNGRGALRGGKYVLHINELPPEASPAYWAKGSEHPEVQFDEHGFPILTDQDDIQSGEEGMNSQQIYSERSLVQQNGHNKAMSD